MQRSSGTGLYLLQSANEQRNHFQCQALGSAENPSSFYLQDDAHGDFDYRYRFRLALSDRRYRSGLVKDRALAPGSNYNVQVNVPGWQKGFGTEFSGMAKPRPFSLCRKPTSEKPARNCWLEIKRFE